MPSLDPVLCFVNSIQAAQFTRRALHTFSYCNTRHLFGIHVGHSVKQYNIHDKYIVPENKCFKQHFFYVFQYNYILYCATDSETLRLHYDISVPAVTQS